MKFLCVACDEPMLLREASGPHSGTMSIVYRCPSCDHDIAMLTNRMETQMVRSLGVKIGGRKEEAPPMETLRSSLAVQREGVSAAGPSEGSSQCPFTGVVTAAFAEESAAPTWTAGAQARIGAIPSFVQPMVKKGVEDFARERGFAEITEAVLDEAKGRLGM